MEDEIRTGCDDNLKICDHKFKVLILGDAGTGKTSLTRRFALNDFQSSYMATIGIDFLEKTVQVDEQKVKLQIWDTAGQERFRTLIRPYYRGAAGIVLVYDVTDEATFEHLKQWMVSIEENVSEYQIIQKIVVANKSDLLEHAITKTKGLALAKSFNSPFYEVSAKDGRNVEEAFQKLASIMLKAQNPVLDPNPPCASIPLEIVVNPDRNLKKDKKCCNI